MAHHGYIPFAHNFLSAFKNPRVLEIGIDKGITTFSMLHRLSSLGRPFSYLAIDILVRKEVIETIKYMGLDLKSNNVNLIEENSLKILPQLVESKNKFDLIFLDGDHNYYTVINELKSVKEIMHENSIVIADDYHGRWKDLDGFYCEYDEHLQNKKATQLEDARSLDKQGVNQAIDEFLEKNESFKSVSLMQGEPIVLYLSGNAVMKQFEDQ